MTLPANINNLVASIEKTKQRQAATGADGDSVFLKMDKTGVWVYGADETEVEPGSRWAINPNSLMTGYVCWGDGELIDEAMAPITDTPVIKSELPQHNEPWAEQVGFQIVCISGEDKGTQAVYKVNSKGGRKAFSGILNAILGEARKGSDKIVPVVEMSSDHYKHKTYGKVYTPIFDIKEWCALDATEVPEETAEAESEPEPEQPKRRRRSKASA